jgi:hypothetical protein
MKLGKNDKFLLNYTIGTIQDVTHSLFIQKRMKLIVYNFLLLSSEGERMEF